MHRCVTNAGVALGCLLGATVVWAAAAAGSPAAPAEGQPVLTNASNWRWYAVNRAPVARGGGRIQTLGLQAYGGVWKPVEGAKNLSPTIESPPPPADWAAADFDDIAWTRTPGPFFPSHHGHAYCKEVEDAGYTYFESTYPTMAVLCLRGKFRVTDRAKAGDLKLSLAYRGGVVVYLNGREIARANIPEAEKARGIEALAEDYPRDVFVKSDGKVISWGFGDPANCHAQLQQRIRRLDGVVVPGRLLRDGVNVLAVEAHRAPYDEAIQGTSESGRGKGYLINWCMVGVTKVELTGAGGAVTPNVARPEGLQVWNQDPQQRVAASDYGDPCEPLGPIRLAGARNGAFSGQVVVGSTAALRGLKAMASELTGPGTIPAENVLVRYALPDKDTNLPFEVLSPSAPATDALGKGGAVMPVWVTVKVPADARPGEYKGALALSVEGAAPVRVPIELSVASWTMPDSKEFISHVGLTQSPESVAMRYKVPLWSDEHWKLLDKSFELLGEAGADDVFITALRRTHFGNEQGMVRWVRGPDGSLTPDLSIAERYLDLAIRRLGAPPVICLYCWEPFTGSNYGNKVSKGNRGMPYTIVDAATGKLEEAEGPKWGTPEIRPFWKPVFEELRGILRKRGLEGSLMVGVAGDSRPNKDAVEDLQAVAPEAKWVVQSHMLATALSGQPVGYLADVWNSPVPPDPAEKRLYGWRSPVLRTTFPRAGSSTVNPLRDYSPPVQYRVALEGMSAAGLRGFGRVGADFWEVLDAKAMSRNGYSGRLNILGRFLESNWSQLYLGNSTAYVLAPGPDGALPTVRFEMIREGAQDMEARVFLEKALLDDARRAKLGEDLARRCQQLLDDRVHAILIGRTSWLLFSGGQRRLEQLYALAGEAAGKLEK